MVALILRIYLLAAAFLVVTTVPVLGQTTASVGGRLIGNHPAEVERRRPVGRAVAHRELQMRITFAIRNRPALDRLLAEQRDPVSPNYRHWLTPSEFAKRFGVGRSDFDAVSNWLRSRGFKVVSASLPRRYIEFSGPVSLAERVFKVAIATFGSADSYANLGDPSVPARFLGVIGSIDGLDNFRHSMPLVRRRQSPPQGSSRAHNNLVAPQTIVGGDRAFGPSDLRTFYDENPLLGNGITGAGGDCIAIIGDSDYLDAAVSEFDSQFGLPASNITRVVGGSNKGINSDESEALLDLEWSHAVAPGAAQRYYFSATGLTDAISSAISDDACGAINISFIYCGASNSFYTGMDSLFSQAAAQGQSVFVASDDDGAAGLVVNSQGNACVTGSTRNVSELAASPNATGVGGTQYSPTWNGSGNDIGSVPESVWDESIGASGGGASAIFSKPAYQTGPGVPADGFRHVPDIAMIASPDLPGVFLGDDSSGTAVIDCCWGGTSLSAPIWAGISKLLSQQAGARIGNINPRVYAPRRIERRFGGLSRRYHWHEHLQSGDRFFPGLGTAMINLQAWAPSTWRFLSRRLREPPRRRLDVFLHSHRDFNCFFHPGAFSYSDQDADSDPEPKPYASSDPGPYAGPNCGSYSLAGADSHPNPRAICHTENSQLVADRYRGLRTALSHHDAAQRRQRQPTLAGYVCNSGLGYHLRPIRRNDHPSSRRLDRNRAFATRLRRRLGNLGRLEDSSTERHAWYPIYVGISEQRIFHSVTLPLLLL